MSKVIESGCISGDCFNGTGKRVYENGYYEGEFKDGLFHGIGFLKHEIGFYKGEFKEGKDTAKVRSFLLIKKMAHIYAKEPIKMMSTNQLMMNAH